MERGTDLNAVSLSPGFKFKFAPNVHRTTSLPAMKRFPEITPQK
jgi:hypothetical protein